jgi:hypothetical protein
MENQGEKLLVNAILSSNIYKHPEDYIYGRDTFYVENFNNVINVYLKDYFVTIICQIVS